jgi:hypothetical protein
MNFGLQEESGTNEDFSIASRAHQYKSAASICDSSIDMTARIPQPPTIPFLGNVTLIDKDLPARSFALLAQKYGEIYQLNLLGVQPYPGRLSRLNTHPSRTFVLR